MDSSVVTLVSHKRRRKDTCEVVPAAHRGKAVRRTWMESILWIPDFDRLMQVEKQQEAFSVRSSATLLLLPLLQPNWKFPAHIGPRYKDGDHNFMLEGTSSSPQAFRPRRCSLEGCSMANGLVMMVLNIRRCTSYSAKVNRLQGPQNCLLIQMAIFITSIDSYDSTPVTAPCGS